MKKHIKNRKGFTLIELAAVICIICILAAVALPSYLNVRRRAQEAAFDSNVRLLKQAAIEFTIDHPNVSCIWAPFAGQERNPETVITDRNYFEAWQEYISEYPKDDTRAPGSTFVVEIKASGEVTISPSTYGGAE